MVDVAKEPTNDAPCSTLLNAHQIPMVSTSIETDKDTTTASDMTMPGAPTSSEVDNKTTITADMSSASDADKPSIQDTTPSDTLSSDAILDPSKVYLTLLLVSGKRKTFPYNPSLTIGDVKSSLVQEWPKEWSDETFPSQPCNLRIVFLGKILDDNVTLQDAKFTIGSTTIAHLTIKNPLPSDPGDLKSSGSAPKCSCIIL